MAKDILINLPTNLGDVILALPTLDRLRASYPDSKLTAVVSPKTKDFVVRNNFIDEVVIFNKLWKTKQKMRFSLDLRGKYEVVVDFKNSLLPIILGARKHTPFIRRFPKNTHIKEKYLSLIEKLAPAKALSKSEFTLNDSEKKKWDSLGLSKSIFIACGSLSPLKEYPYEYLKEVVESLKKKHKIIILGTKKNRTVYKDILLLEGVFDLVGKTEMIDVYYLLKNWGQVVLGVDSSITHLASYLDIPVVAIFGPTSYERSQPWSKGSIVLQREDLDCLPCEKANCFNIKCMRIEPQKVIKAIEQVAQSK